MSLDTVVDPGLDPAATYAVDPAVARRLARHAVASAGAQTFTATSPLTGGPIAALPVASEADVEAAFARARQAQVGWAARSVAERAAVALRLHDLVLDRQVQLLDLVQIESGKARLHAFEEVADLAVCARHYGRAAASYLAPRRVLGAYPVLTQAVVAHHPKGVVGVVSPWNYPLSLSMTDALPALLAGNTVVLRPDEQGALTALAGAELLAEAGLPEGALQVVLGPGSSTGQAVVDRGDHVSYTGSTATGRRVAQSVAGRLVGYSLELGGKNSAYVAADADLERTIPGLVRSCYSSAGQLCVSIERVLVHDRVYDEVVTRLAAAVEAMTVSTALEYGYDMGSLVSAEHLAAVEEHVADAVAKGARVLAGGRRLPEAGPWCYAPTLLEGVTTEMACRDEETFGPVVAVYRVGSDEEAVALANDTEYGLNASVWTRDVARGRALAARIRTGTVNINEGYAATWASMGAPMGGMKSSGLGRRHGAEGILRFTESQTVAAQHLLPFAPTLGMSQGVHARVLTGALKALKVVGLR